ncbi:HAMP domain-containing sensor histidine kinase [Sulfurovum sp.]|uniref:sensor histidine kinase n=1 Tax=Sulfurovum sp. TaxID=1969726 RepID=UPI0025E9EEAF|nr:HAMP domain-containing sensor histidine kinase [Sulfurovum sp.]
MHIQEVFNAIYENHKYEYFVINHAFEIIEYSDRVFKFCDGKICEMNNMFDLVPELCGMEVQLNELFNGTRTSLTIPYIFKEPGYYINIHMHPGRRKSIASPADAEPFESLIVLFEDTTAMAETQQSLVQERNEKSLLLEEISVKNAQLETFNEQMQELVALEIQKNLEKQKMLELESRYSQMGEMINMITHQWKQPLSSISLTTNVLKMKEEKHALEASFLTDKLDSILKQTEYMDQTVQAFQDFFKPLKEKVTFNVFDAVSHIVDLVGDTYELQHISVDIKGEKEVFAYGYPNEFKQVILILLKNAKDAFLAAPSDTMQITIETAKEKDKCLVTVSDNAGGIPEAMIDTVFDLYISTKEEGSGLGLTIAKTMIEDNMQGRLSVRNTEDGALFSIRI